VLVIDPLRALLAELREAEGNPAKGPILRGVKLSEEGKPKPLNLNMLAREVIRPALRNPKNYRDPETKRLEWHGFYSLRRGIATQLVLIRLFQQTASLRGVDSSLAQHMVPC
jgi:hypothetical protein